MGAHPEADPTRADVEEDQSKGGRERGPERDEADDEAEQSPERGQVAKGFGAEEARERVLFHTVRSQRVFQHIGGTNALRKVEWMRTSGRRIPSG